MTEQLEKAAAEPPLDCRVGLPAKLRAYVNDNGDWAAGLLPADVLAAAEAIEGLARYAHHLQAKIDALMLEYCPDEMTPEQIAEWERWNKQVPNLNSPTDSVG